MAAAPLKQFQQGTVIWNLPSPEIPVTLHFHCAPLSRGAQPGWRNPCKVSGGLKSPPGPP